MELGRATMSDSAPAPNIEPAASDPFAMQLNGDQLFERGDFAAAEEIFRRLFGNGYAPNWCCFQLGRIAARQQRWDEAVKNFDKALAGDSAIVWAWFEKGLALRQCGADKSASIAELACFARQEPKGLSEGHYAVLLQAANDAFDAQAYPDALALYRFVRESGYGGYLGKLRCADAHLLSGDAEAALRILDEAPPDPGDDIWGDLTRARALLALGRYDAAAALARALLARAPENADVVGVLITALEGADDRAELASFERYLYGLPEAQRILFLLRAKLRTEDYDGAARLWNEHPSPARSLLLNAVRELQRRRDFATAERLIDSSGLKFDPGTNLPLKRAAVVCWDLSHNPVGRAAVLCKLLETDWAVELIGPIWRRFGNSLWKPLQGEGLTVSSCHASTLPDVWREGAKIALGRRYDIVIICKPRLPGLVLGLLLAEQSGCPLLVDVDEDELAFSPRPNDPGRLDRELIEEPFAAVGSRLAIENLDAADAVTVSNPALLSRFPGHIVRHARDERAPLVDRAEARRRLGFTSDDFVIAFIGTTRPHKGLSHVIAALQAIDDPRLKLLVAGSVSRDVERELADPRLCGRIVQHPPFAISEIGVFLAAADLVPILQDPDTLIARTQLPAKFVDALWYGLATVATDVVPIRDIAACGVVDVIAGADFAGYLKAMRARPPQPQLQDQRKRVFAGEFGLAVNRARLAAAIREATMRHDPERSRVRARLAHLLAETRAAAAAVREADAETATKHQRSLAQAPDLAFFWKQNDSGLFGRRSDHVLEDLLKSGRIGRIIHFDHTLSLGDLRHMVGEDSKGSRNGAALQLDQTFDRIFELSDEPRLKRRVFIVDRDGDSAGLAGRAAGGADHFADFVGDRLRAGGLDPRRTIAWVCPVVQGFAEIARKLCFRKIVVDLIDDQRTWPASDGERARLQAEYEGTLRVADLVFANSAGNRRRFADLRGDIVVVPNGAELPDGSEPIDDGAQFAALPRPIIGYVGNMRHRVDWGLVRELAVRRPSWSFVMIGPIEEGVVPPTVSALPNVIFPGPAPYHQARSWMQGFDVAMMPHLRCEMTNSMSPLKLYNYLAVGVPVVTAPVANIEELTDLVGTGGNADEFLAAIEERLSAPRTPVPRERLAGFSWDRRVSAMLDRVEALF